MQSHQRHTISKQTAEKIVKAWNPDVTLRDNMENAGIVALDQRELFRYRRNAEEITGVMLELNSKYKSENNFSNPWAGLDKKEIQDNRIRLNKLIRSKARSRYIITSAQNNTDIYHPFWENLLVYAEHCDAQIIVIPVRYKNPTAFIGKEDKSDHVWYPPEVIPYLINERIRLHKDLTIMGDVRIPATAADPLTSKEKLAEQSSCILGHPQLRLKTVPTPQFRLPIVLSTTGSASVKNYSESSAGAIGYKNHSIAAAMIELDGKYYHQRQIVADHKGDFIDLTHEVSEGKILDAPPITALVTGDEHAIFMDEGVKSATYTDKNSIVNVLKPEYIVRHDVLDFHSGTHHHNKNEFAKFKKWKQGLSDVRKELEFTCKHIDQTTPDNSTNIIVDSNHHRHLQRWLMENDSAKDQQNTLIFHYLKWKVLQYIEDNQEIPDPFLLYCEENLNTINRTEFADPNKGFLRHKIDLSQHGDIGSKGAKGNIKSFARSSYASVIGHSHDPGILGDIYQVGKSAGNLEYEKGLNSTMNTHCLLYANGKRTLVNIISGRWKK